MRTTLDLDPSVLEAARQFATHRSISLGKAISELALKGLRASPVAAPMSTGRFPVFATRADAPVLTLEDVKLHLDDAT